MEKIEQADYIVAGNDMFYALSDNESGMELLGTAARNKGDRRLWYYTDKVFEDSEYWYLKTSTDRHMGVWMERIRKSDLSTKRVKYPGVDINVLAAGHDQILASVNTLNRILFEVYDLDLNHLETREIPYRSGELDYIFEQQMELYGDGWILLAGIKPSGTEWDYIENHLLVLDAQLNPVKDMDLGFCTGSVSSFLEHEGRLYLAISRDGTDEQQRGLPASRIEIKDSETLELLGTIDTGFSSQGRVRYDATSNQIILDRTGRLDERNVPYIHIDPNTLSAEPIVLPDSFRFEKDVPVYSQFYDGKAWLLSRQDLAILDLNTGECQIFDLNTLGVDRGLGLLLKTGTGTFEK